jgi:4-hydroxybenzoate polyprenyltransferase
MGRVGALARATHLAPAAFVTVLTGVVVLALGGSTAEILASIASTGLGQASVGWSNDYLDRERDTSHERTDKPLVESDLPNELVIRLAVTAFFLSSSIALLLGWQPAAIMTTAVASAWSYNFWLKNTAFSWVPYAISFGLLPLFAWTATRYELPPAWLMLSAGALGVAGHLMNAIPDLEEDALDDIKGLPQRLGQRRSLRLATMLLAALLIVFAERIRLFDHPTAGQVLPAVLATGAIAGAAVAAGSSRPRTGWYLTMGAVAAIALVLILGLSRAGLSA